MGDSQVLSGPKIAEVMGEVLGLTVRSRHAGSDHSTLQVAELFSVGRSTVYRAIERQRVQARACVAKAKLS
jgi:uncharacterized protein YbjQ (UPF0145 family)